MENFSNIVDRIKMLLNLDHDKELANYLNISPILLSAWKQRNSPNWEIIFEKMKDYDLNYIIYGEVKNEHSVISENINEYKNKNEKQELLIELLLEKLQKEERKKDSVKT